MYRERERGKDLKPAALGTTDDEELAEILMVIYTNSRSNNAGKSMRRHLNAVPEAPQANGYNPDGKSGGDTNFDTNMVIILAALLCALICALGLNSIVRCAMRCGRRMAFETTEEAAARLAATGLKKRALRQIPVAVYGPGANIPATDCPICLGEFAEGEKVRVLPKCNHGFHVRCIDRWLASHSSCPTCRNSLLDRTAGPDSADAGAGEISPGSRSRPREVPAVITIHNFF